MSDVIKRRLAAVAGGLVLAAAALAVWGAARSEAIIIIGGKPAEMVGGGWVAVGDGSVRPQFQVGLPCPGEDVGFNPQPDPPGHDRARLTVHIGGERYQLDELTGAACTIDDVEDREGATHEGSGLASCGGDRGFIIDWRLTDGGLGGPDTAEISIRGPGADVACTNNLHIGGPLGGGNLQMPAAQGR
jgi:hypothetical protein